MSRPQCDPGPCIWITRANYEAHPNDWDEYHVHIIENETGRK